MDGYDVDKGKGKGKVKGKGIFLPTTGQEGPERE
jgi:hypothetical protein